MNDIKWDVEKRVSGQAVSQEGRPEAQLSVARGVLMPPTQRTNTNPEHVSRHPSMSTNHLEMGRLMHCACLGSCASEAEMH